MNIQGRYERLHPNLLRIAELWNEELQQHKHLLSISSAVGEFCGWDPKRIKDYCLSLGFNGAKVRFQDFEELAKLVHLAAARDFLLTAHLTDFAHWLYSPQQLRELMSEEEIEAYFGGSDHQKAVAKRFLEELDWAEKLGITTVTFHAAQIEFLGVLDMGFKFSDDEVLTRVGNFVTEMLPQSSFAGRFGLENDAPYTRGMRLPEHFGRLLRSIDLPNVGITLDIAHLVAHSLELEPDRELTRRIWTVHLSEPSLVKPPKVTKEEFEEARNRGFFPLRQLMGGVVRVIDAHNPVGGLITDSRRRLGRIYEANPDLVVVHELKVPLELLPQACKLQQAQLIGVA